MKAIVSLFISAYQPRMASIECRANSLKPLLRDDRYGDGFSEARGYKDTIYDDWPNEELDCSEDDCFGGQRFGDACFENQHLEDPNYEDVCWMISRARRSQQLGYCVMYLRYVSHHSGYAKTLEASLRQHTALHPDLKDSLSTFLVTWLQQQEDLFCQTLHQQLIEYHNSL